MPTPAPGSSVSLFSAMPSAPPVPHMESADYWGAAPNAAGGPLLNPYLSPLPPMSPSGHAISAFPRVFDALWPDADRTATVAPVNPRKPGGFGGLQGQILPPRMPTPAPRPHSSVSLFSAMPSAPPVPHRESAGFWGSAPNAAGGPLPSLYLSPVPPAPDWNEVPTTPTANEAEIFAVPPQRVEDARERAYGPLSWQSSVPSSFDEAAAAEAARHAAAMRLGQWRRRGTQEYQPPPPLPPAVPSAVDEAAAAEMARRAAAMRLGQWRGRGTEEYEPPPPPAPEPPKLPEPPLPREPHAFFSNKETFFVRDKTGNYYPATFLTYSDGTPVVDSVLAKGLSGHPPDQLALFSDTAGTIYNPNNLPDPGNGNPNDYLVVPDRDYMNIMASRGRMYGGLVRGAESQRKAGGDSTGAHAAAKTIVSGTFVPKAGYGDAQYQMGGTGWGLIGPVKDIVAVPARDYLINPALSRAGYLISPLLGPIVGLEPIGLELKANDHFIPAFTNAGNYAIGAFYQGAGLPIQDAIDLFGYANAKFGAGLVDDQSNYPGGLSRWGYNALTQGYGDTDLNTKLYSQLGVPAVAPNTSRTWSLLDSLGRLITDRILSSPAY